jgi:putative two-component system response regulator
MTHKRPYRDAISPEQALAEIHACKGTQFDPSVVAALLTVADTDLPVAADVADA